MEIILPTMMIKLLNRVSKNHYDNYQGVIYMFTSRELNTFICVAEEKSVKKAAERLSITAPAVSCMIKKLEERLNLNLFNYSNLSMEMTNCGQAIYESVSVYYHALHDIEKSLTKDNSIHIMVYLNKDFYFLEYTIKHFLSSLGYTATITNKRSSAIMYDIEFCRSNMLSKTKSISFDFLLLSNSHNVKTLTMDDNLNDTSYFKLLTKKIESFGFNQYLFSNEVNEQLEMLNSGISNLVIPSSGILSQLMVDSFPSRHLIKINGEVKLNYNNNITEKTYAALMDTLNTQTPALPPIL